MRQAFYILILFFACVSLAPEAFAHKYHTSVTRLEYNAEEHTAEITIQMFVEDLENILGKRARKPVRLDGGKDAERIVFNYLQGAFELQSRAGKFDLQWVGMEMKGEMLWIYAMTKMPEGLSKVSVRNSLLFDLYDDQVNIVNVLSGEKKTGLVFKHGDSIQAIP